ncbi:hypothetical protein JKP88DRAFT_273117 [Tribonema minus]|uniref:Thioredoxin domain-containing protein n=1 Tax=Tribonema minus TaxID=303371 RepID=A0A835Z4T3_9STRA|nr:hypothetical protein JKP88DRAFT_273117 [Tribonema minus]
MAMGICTEAVVFSLVVLCAGLTGAFLGATCCGEGELPSDFHQRGTVVAVVASWCGHCEALKPELDALGSDPEVKLYVFDADSPSTAKFMQAFDVRAYPTLFVRGQKYSGDRTAAAIKAAALM